MIRINVFLFSFVVHDLQKFELLISDKEVLFLENTN